MGFVPGHQAGDNVCKAIDLIHILHQWKIPGFLLFGYLQSIWRFAGITSNSFCHNGASEITCYHGSWPCINCLHPKKWNMEAFLLICSLFLWVLGRVSPSLVLFILALEPLAAAISGNVDMSGVTYTGVQYKAFFAGDALLILTNLFISLPNLKPTVDCFSAFSDLQMNPSKTFYWNGGMPSGAFPTSLGFPLDWLPRHHINLFLFFLILC